VDTPRTSWEIIDAFRDAAVETGIPATDDFNRGNNEGVSRFEVTQKSGVRWSAARAFLDPARPRPNLTVVTNALVHRVTFEGRRATGVEFSRNGVLEHAGSSRETLLSAGAIGSPQILQLSGIGPAALLQQHGIPVVQDLPVGENLQDHLQLRLAFRVSNALTLNTLLDSWWAKAKMALEYAFKRTGPLTMPPSQLGALAKLPTTREAGFPMVADNWRLLIAPKGLSAIQVAYWDNAFKTLAQSKEWNDDLAAAQMSNSYRNSADTTKYIAEEYGDIKDILGELGLAKAAK